MEIVLCVPGPWADRSELVESIAKHSGGYIFAGRVLMHLASGRSVELEFEGPDERMLGAFEAAGPHWSNTVEMQSISNHKSVCYLIGDGGSIEAAHAMMEAATGLLNAGGLGVKVESAGIAHSPADWQEQCQYKHLFESHTSYVVYIRSDNTYSCGMHNFGLSDAVVANSDAENPAELLRVFTHYLLAESPQIEQGQTFSAHADAPIYRIYQHPAINYGEGSLFNNPYGTWLLQAEQHT